MDIPPERVLSAEELLSRISEELGVSQGQQIVHVEQLDTRLPEYDDPTPSLPPLLRGALDYLGISQLYVHQVESLNRVRSGENIVVVTSTSSGKTLCYNLPIIEQMLRDREARALYLYPINALVNDQLKSLFRINLALGQEALGIARYTGALSSQKRKEVRARSPNIFLTNPEMLHLSFLLWHQNWEEFWRNLRFIVIDEVHTYRGVFGSNMAHLFRRALRMAEHYGSAPQFICCSATIANPKELVEDLVGLPFSIVDRDGSGRGRRHFVLWNPPLLSSDGSNLRRSYAEESVDLLLRCVRADYNTILFARARRLTERMLRMGRALTEERGETELLDQVSSYRAGYLAEERESIESKLKMGDIRGIITTNALEMGIDIGGLDAAIISGYPGTIMSTWQQAGRAGRRGREALIFLVASQNPLDQYYMSHPSEFFAQPHELAVVDLHNPYIRLKHLLCAARELPLSADEVTRMPASERDTIAQLRDLELLEPSPLDDGSDGLVYPASGRDIHFQISLRSASHESYRILDQNRNEVGTIEPPNVYREAHPGAIYQHGDDDYRVTFLDRKQKAVHVREENAPHYTRSMSMLNIQIESVYTSHILEPDADAVGVPLGVALGDVLVEERVYGYEELRLGTDEMVKRVNLDFPLVIRLQTTAMWLVLPRVLETVTVALVGGGLREPADQESDEHALFGAGLHALEHLLAGVMPLLVMCDRRDVDGFHDLRHARLDAPAIFLYDSYEGGIGLAEIAYQRIGDLLNLAFGTVERCPCIAGCPSCIQSGTCRQRNEVLHKEAARTVLSLLTGRRTLQGGADLYDQSSLAIHATRADEGAATDFGTRRALQDLLERTRRKSIYDRVLSAPTQPTVTATGPAFAKGDWVECSPYGRGIVMASRMQGEREIVTVRFQHRNMERDIDASKGGLRKSR